MTDPTTEDFLLVGKDIQNKSGRKIGSTSTEDRAFREFFGMNPRVTVALWKMMNEYDFIPPEGEINHLLWTLHFLKAYPKQGTVCSTAGGSCGAIDPKTLRKYMWPFIHAIAALEPAVVSFNKYFLLLLLNLTHHFFTRSSSKVGKQVAV